MGCTVQSLRWIHCGRWMVFVLKMRRIQRVFSSLTMVMLFLVPVEAQASRDLNSLTSTHQKSVSDYLTTQKTLFGRSFIEAWLMGPPISKATNSSNTAFKPIHRSAKAATHRLQSQPGSKRFIDAFLQARSFTQNDQGLPLSYFCRFDCETPSVSTRIACWVPSDKGIAIVPFSVTGNSLCEARKMLCTQLEDVGRVVDNEPFVCKDLTTNTILVRGEASFDQLNGGVVIQTKKKRVLR